METVNKKTETTIERLNRKYEMKLYHITDVRNVKSILENGLIANDYGEIFLFENTAIIYADTGMINHVADCIATNQIFLKRYAMIEVDCKDFADELENDNVGEISAQYQFYVKRKKIDKKFLNLFGIYKSDYKSFY